MSKNHPVLNLLHLILCRTVIVVIFSFPFYSKADKKIYFNLAGAIYNEASNKTLEGVKVDLIKDKVIVQTIVTSSNGKYKLSWEINQTDSNDANYIVNFSHEKMIPKSAKINTYIRQPLANAYDFDLAVYMTERKEDDVIIDLPSAKIKWDERAAKFSVDQKYANVMKKIKEQDDPKKLKELIEQQKREEDVARRKDEEKKEAEKKAAQEAVRKNLEALRKQQEELERQATLQKAREDSAKQAAEDALKKTFSAIKEQVKEIKKEEAIPPPPPPPKPEPIKVEERENESEIAIREIYSIRDAKALRGKRYTASKDLQKRKIKNWSNKYETENPLTSLLDEIDQYEKNLKNSNNQ